MNPLFHTGFSISDSLKSVLKSVLIYETIILDYMLSRFDKYPFLTPFTLQFKPFKKTTPNHHNKS